MFRKKLTIQDIYGAWVFFYNLDKKRKDTLNKSLVKVKNKELGFGQINLSEKWGWYNSLYMLANEDILKINKVTKLPVYEVLTFMTYKQDLNEKLENERRQHKI